MEITKKIIDELETIKKQVDGLLSEIHQRLYKPQKPNNGVPEIFTVSCNRRHNDWSYTRAIWKKIHEDENIVIADGIVNSFPFDKPVILNKVDHDFFDASEALRKYKANEKNRCS